MARPRTLSTVVQEGDYRRSLLALRDKLAREIDDAVDGRDVATLSRQLTLVLDKINGLPDAEAVTPADEIARRTADELAAQRTKRAEHRGAGTARL